MFQHQTDESNDEIKTEDEYSVTVFKYNVSSKTKTVIWRVKPRTSNVQESFM